MQRVKYNPQFKQEVDLYIEDCKKKKETPTIKGFAQRIGTDEQSIWAWANKPAKNKETGEIIQGKLARPQFLAQVNKLKKLSEVKLEQIKKKEENKLNEKQELFCQLYTTDRDFFGNGVTTYAEAYNLDLSKPKDYNTAKSNAWRLLTNDYILKRIDELLELGPLNNTFVDRQLAKIIAQDADFSSKVSAIREYNKLKQRITEKMDIMSGGKPIQEKGILNGETKDVSKNNSNQ